MLDDIDLKILTLLENNARAPWAELAEAVEMSAPGVIDRVRRLEERGIICGYTLKSSHEALGLKLISFVFLELVAGVERESFLGLISSIPEISECHHVTGTHDYLVKIYCRDASHLDSVLVNSLKQSGLVARSETLISLNHSKEKCDFVAMYSETRGARERKKKPPPRR